MEDTSTTLTLKSLESLYLEGKYDEAKSLLLENKTIFTEGAFHYNLGTILGKQELLAASRYHLEKAIKKGYYDSKVQHNLNVVKGHLPADELLKADSIYDLAATKILEAPVSLYLAITLTLISALLLMIRLKLITRLRTIIMATVFSFCPILISYLWLEQISFAITLKDTPLYEGPSKIYSQITTLPAGAKFIVGEANNGWFYIQHPLSRVGWVYKDNLALY